MHRAISVWLQVALLLASVTSCAHAPSRSELTQAPAPHLSPMAPGGLVDARARFRTTFCGAFDRARAQGSAVGKCDDWLWRLADEPTGSGSPPATPVPLQVYLITGAFSECFGEETRLFVDAIAGLEAKGYVIDTIVVGGRSGTEHNAQQIAEYFSSHEPAPGLPVVVIGYSKGISDALEFVVGYPDLAQRVDAVVSLAGAVFGSPLAENTAGLYAVLLSHWPHGTCEVGDRGVIDSLKPTERRRWLEEHTLPDRIRYFSLPAFTTRERVARVLVPAWRWLLDRDPHTDGQLIARDALLPNSTVLGYLHADHWDAIIDIERDLKALAARQDPRPYPRAALFEAVLSAVGESLALE